MTVRLLLLEQQCLHVHVAASAVADRRQAVLGAGRVRVVAGRPGQIST
jgi:hypothetical protein